MADDLRKSTVSHYALVASGRDGIDFFVDLFIPELLLKQLEIRPNSKVIIQGQPLAEDAEFFLRARSGVETVGAGRSPFTATVRMRNQPKVLDKFLTRANIAGVGFQGIRTFGYRAKEESDLVFEGSVPDQQRHFV